MNTRKRAFTLIEMLVVIAVLLILAAILFPALSRMREKGREVMCQSNLHQLQVATISYAQDHDNHLPRSRPSDYQYVGDRKWYHCTGWVDWLAYPDGSPNDPTDTQRQNFWQGDSGRTCISRGDLFTYLQGQYGVYLCPTFALKEVCGVDDPARSYAMNLAFFSQCPASSYNLYGVTNAARIVLFGDSLLKNPEGSPPGSLKCDGEFDPATELGRYHVTVNTNQTGEGNAVFLDGHVRKSEGGVFP